MTDVEFNEILDIYIESGYNAKVLSDKQVDAYIEKLNDMMKALIIVRSKLVDEQYQRIIDKQHAE